jgi:hypothetical protein
MLDVESEWVSRNASDFSLGGAFFESQPTRRLLRLGGFVISETPAQYFKLVKRQFLS